MLAPVLAGSSVKAQTLKSDEVFSSLVVRPVAPANPVLGSDDRIHLAYELSVVNQHPFVITIDAIEALAPSGTVLAEVKGQTLAKLIRINGGIGGSTLDPGRSAYIVLDVTLPKGSPVPATLDNRLSLTRMNPGKDGAAPVPLPPGGALPPTDSFVGARVAVDRSAAVVIAPPLRGAGWVVANGCCAAPTSHRGAILAVNGTEFVAERFAIDFVRIDGQGRLFEGSVDRLSSYRYFGVPVHAVADGVVAAVADGLPEEVPGKVPESSSPRTAGGNFVIVDIGEGRFAFYAHLQPGSPRVKAGNRVKVGDILGLLGNSGNTTAPHLHFHVMDRPTPLAANGLPYVFASFAGDGVMRDADDDDAFFTTGAPATVDRAALAGAHVDQLPLNNQVVTFPD
jgi:hypothetical protein